MQLSSPLKPNSARARIAVYLICAVLFLEIISLYSGYLQYELLDTVARGEFISMDEANANDNRELIVSVIYLIAMIISAITFISWFRRAYYNLHQLDLHVQHEESWAAGSWFVPFINLYRPYQIMKELFDESRRFLIRAGESVLETTPHALLILWWALWLLSGIAGQILFRMDWETIEELKSVTVMGMLVNILGIPLALLAIRLIKDFDRLELRVHETALKIAASAVETADGDALKSDITG